MGVFFVYILKSALTLALLYAVYCLALRRETFHAFNRVVLIAIVVVSLVVSAIPFSTSHPTVVNEGIARIEIVLTKASSASTTTDDATTATAAANVSNDKSTTATADSEASNDRAWWPIAVVAIYIIGVVVALGRYAFQVVRLALRLRRQSSWHLKGGARLVRTDVPIEGSPFSWGHTVVVSRKDLDDNARAILAHEFAHVRYGHTFDRTLCEVVARLQWFNPFARMLTADLCTVHEYQADRAALRRTPSAEAYSLMLIRKATSLSVQPVVSSLSRSSLKRRMVMMFTAPSRRSRAARALYLVPLIVCTVAAYARPELAEEMPQLPFVAESEAAQSEQTANANAEQPNSSEPSAATAEETEVKSAETANDNVLLAAGVSYTHDYGIDQDGSIVITFKSDDDKHIVNVGSVSSVVGDTIVYYNGRRLSSAAFTRYFGKGKAARDRLFKNKKLYNSAHCCYIVATDKDTTNYNAHFASLPREVVHDLTGEAADVCIVYGDQVDAEDWLSRVNPKAYAAYVGRDKTATTNTPPASGDSQATAPNSSSFTNN